MKNEMEGNTATFQAEIKSEIRKGVIQSVSLTVAIMGIMLWIFAYGIDAKISLATEPLKVHMEYMTKRMDNMESDIAAIKAAVVK